MCKRQDVTKIAALQNGLVRASAVYGKTLLLLFEVKKNVEIQLHHHPHVQMGYVFSGSFDFLTDSKHYENLPRQSYIIRENQNHKVVATADFYSMDIKYIGASNIREEIKYDVFQTITDTINHKLEKVVLTPHAIYKLSFFDHAVLPFQLNKNKTYCFAVCEKGTLFIDHTPYEVHPMRFYTYPTKQDYIYLASNSDPFDLLIFEIAP